MFKNIFGFSFDDEYNEFAAPKYATVGLSHIIGPTTISLDNEVVFGRFGGYEKHSANIWFLRCGIDRHLSQVFSLRAGIVLPVIAETSATGDLKKELPWPGIGASLGLGFTLERVDIDLALYGDQARSYFEQQPVLGATGTLIFNF